MILVSWCLIDGIWWNWWMFEESLRPSTPSIIHVFFGSLAGRSVGKMPACLMLKLTQILLGYLGIQPCGLVHPNYNWWFFALPLWKMMEFVSRDHYSQPMESLFFFLFQTTNQTSWVSRLHEIFGTTHPQTRFHWHHLSTVIHPSMFIQDLPSGYLT